MRPLILVIFLAAVWCEIDAQLMPPPPSQRPVFENKADAIAYEELDAALIQRAERAKNVKTLDSVQTVRRAFLDTHRFVWRTTFRQDVSFTPYQSLASIANKDSITSISIVGKGRRRLPDSLYLYKNLAELELIDFKLSRLPKKLGRQSGLKKILLYNNFPDRRLKLPKSSSVTTLIIRGDEKGKLPKSYKRFKNLVYLNLSRNNLREFPNTAGCEKLAVLSLIGNAIQLDKEPREYSHTISGLDLSLNGITQVPSWIGKFQNLSTLNLNNNKIEKIEPGIEKIQGLQELLLYKNNLKEMPPMLYTMKSLRVIDLYFNHIPVITRDIANWKDLEILYLANNDLYSIPDEIGQLTKLRELYLHHNKLSNLPASVANLKGLNVLRINNNNLLEWPVALTSLKLLVNLDCSSNQFESLPISDLDFRNMKILSLGGNPWSEEMRKNIDLWANALRENHTVVHLGRNDY